MRKNNVLFFTAALAAFALAALALTGCPGNDPASTLTAPGTPRIVAVTAADKQLTVEWGEVEYADTYEVKWGAENKETGITGTSYVITGLDNGTSYSVQVRATNDLGESEWSEAKAETPKEPDSVPATPPAPVVAVDGDTLTVTWTAVAGATTYRVFYGQTNEPTDGYANADESPATFAVLSPGDWYVRIKAGNSIGFGEYSPVTKVTVKAEDVVDVVGSWTWKEEWTDENGVAQTSTYTYTFGENWKLTYTNSGSTYTNYYFYDPTERNVYRTRSYTYTLEGDNLSISLDGGYPSSLTSAAHTGLVGTWTGDGTTIEITATTIKIGSNTHRYYTSGGTIYYKWGDELAYRYTISGGKLQLTGFNPATYTSEGSGGTLAGTWKDPGDSRSETWIFKSDKTAERIRKYGDDDTETRKYLYSASGNRLTLKQELGTLSGGTLTINGISCSRVGSGSGITGTWNGSKGTMTMTVTVTSNKVTYEEKYSDGKTQGGSVDITIEGSSIYTSEEHGYKVNGKELTITFEYTDELERVK